MTLLSLFPKIMDAIRSVGSSKIWIGPIEEYSEPTKRTIGNIDLFGSDDATINNGDMVSGGIELGLRVIGGVFDAVL